MPQAQTMTLDEKFSVMNRVIALEKSGDLEGSDRLIKTIPLPSYLAKIAKEKIGSDWLIDGGWNLAEAEAEFGEDWLLR